MIAALIPSADLSIDTRRFQPRFKAGLSNRWSNQTFTTLMLANMMSELRKYGIGLMLAHQYFHQLDIRHAVLSNAGTLISFRVGPEDAAILAKEFQPIFDVHDLLNLPNHSIYLKLMIDGTPSKPFSGASLTPS